jgi:diguanylate cyclase (GGDEF)-like protein/PAS domain S-box-containing protein
MTALWGRSLLFRTVSSIVAITLVVGGLIMLALGMIVAHERERDAYRNLGELLDTVESTVRIACFVGDAELAKEVAQGLLKTREIKAVNIRTEKGELVQLKREVRSNGNARATPALEREIFSPFDNTLSVGHISLEPDTTAIEAQVRSTTLHMATQMSLLILVVTVALTLTVLRLVVRPIGQLSNSLRSLDAASGERLRAPQGHEENVLGSLTEDINRLSSRLVATIEQEKGLRERHKVDELKYRSIFDNAESGIFISNRMGHLTACNRSFLRLTELPEASPESSLFDLGWLDMTSLLDLIANCIESNAAVSDDFELRLPSGGLRWLNLSMTPIGDQSIQCIASDVTDRRTSEDRALRMAVTDPLTGLDNRQGFENRWSALIREKPDTPFVLLIANLEGFKHINDALGLIIGDKLLALIGARIASCLKAEDSVARLGGDEFAIVLSGLDDESTVEKICKRIVSKLCESFLIEGKDASVGASLGAACFPLDGVTLPALMRNAELALAQARSSGGRTWRLFEQSMVQAIEHRHQLASDLRHAADRGELRLFYQPIIDLDTLRVIGAEALIRWMHPVHGLVPPDSFIPLAEETGLIEGIGIWCLHTACRQIAAWQADGLSFRVTINVSARQIPEGIPPDLISQACAEHQVDSRQLGIEITESTLMGESSRVRDWLDEVRSLGFLIYLDDFGTGYSSLSYLKRFPIDMIKIDKAFVRDMSEASNDRVMVEAVIMMAESLSLKVVAEGIENAGQLELLKRMGCNYGQGFHFSRPVPPEQFLANVTRIEEQLQSAG